MSKLVRSRIEKLVYIGMDIDYFQRIIDKYGTEETLREKLKDEREKDIKEQDLEWLNILQKNIAIVEKATNSIVEYKAIEKELVEYLNYIKMYGDKKTKDIFEQLK
jgi:hypothetical protein